MVVAAQQAVGEDGRLKGGRPPKSHDLILEALFYRTTSLFAALDTATGKIIGRCQR
jgi:hypothetical protein